MGVWFIDEKESVWERELTCLNCDCNHSVHFFLGGGYLSNLPCFNVIFSNLIVTVLCNDGSLISQIEFL